MGHMEWITLFGAIGTWVSAGAVAFAYRQLKETRRIAQMQFEDGLNKEYREIISKLPSQILLGGDLPEPMPQEVFDVLYRYIDLCNEQVFLHNRNRINDDVWSSWLEGMKDNMLLPAFRKAWKVVREKKPGSYDELRKQIPE